MFLPSAIEQSRVSRIFFTENLDSVGVFRSQACKREAARGLTGFKAGLVELRATPNTRRSYAHARSLLAAEAQSDARPTRPRPE